MVEGNSRIRKVEIVGEEVCLIIIRIWICSHLASHQWIYIICELIYPLKKIWPYFYFNIVYTCQLLRSEMKTNGFQWCFENADWQSFMKDRTEKLSCFNNQKRCIHIIILYIFLVHDNTKGVFLYIFVFAEYQRDEDGLRYSNRIHWQGCSGYVVEMGQKSTKFYTTKGPWQRTVMSHTLMNYWHGIISS